MEQCFLRIVCSASKKFPPCFGNWKVHVTGAYQSSLSWAKLTQSTPSKSIFLIYMLILSTHLHLGLLSGLFHPGIPIRILYTFIFPMCTILCSIYLEPWEVLQTIGISNVAVSLTTHYCEHSMYMPCSSHPPWFYRPSIWWNVQIMGLIMQLSPASCHFIHHSWVLMFSWALFCVFPSTLKTKFHNHMEQVKLVLYILLFTLPNSTQDKILNSNVLAFPEFFCS
jgi:hypothetical protein